jgi:hypothetical protein
MPNRSNLLSCGREVSKWCLCTLTLIVPGSFVVLLVLWTLRKLVRQTESGEYQPTVLFIVSVSRLFSKARIRGRS